MNILNGDEFNRGYEEGWAEAQKAKPQKNYNFVSFTSAIHGDYSMETYQKGYDEGFRKGLEFKKNNSKNQNNMKFEDLQKNNSQNADSGDAASFKKQLELMEGLKSRLLSLQNGMMKINNAYRNSIEQLRNEGLVVELYNELLDNYYKNTSDTMKGFIEHLNAEDVKFINKKIDELSNL